MNDPFDLERFEKAQRDVYADALAELTDGQKRSHWMWFIFPQIAGLGHSAMAQRYAINSLEEAKAYLEHPVLGERLQECCQQLMQLEGRSAHDIFGSPDDMKLRSSLTLFAAAEPRNCIFEQLLGRYYRGQADTRTLEILQP
ncbi:DUF1810 domain-containing protein [Microbulbifer hainanensis]|uniref:DUF1810 domain-containing protein n=1 Tax=Microbulbifer hainanensis TaxID=2735675 RepID=UPI001865D736|nr:DUF1810 domain-containing protein [Microbulbifer hainanensis]